VQTINKARMKNILNKCLLIALLACLPGLIQAQRVLIRGVVTAYEDKQPLPGAYLLLQNSDGRVVANTITDYEGNYSLLSVIKPGDVLVVSYSGFKKQTIPVENREIINVEMREEILELETATVVGRRQISSGMMSISERDLTTAAVRIEMSELEDLAVASIDDALQGRVAGMDMVTTSGAPGAGMSIRIRGTTSINGSSQPYIIVDGFPYETTISEDFDFSTADEEEYSQMLNIAPGDIKEIIVLKDAAATAIWGSKAANGVLQITTKRGGISPPTVTLGSKGTMSKQAKGRIVRRHYRYYAFAVYHIVKTCLVDSFQKNGIIAIHFEDFVAVSLDPVGTSIIFRHVVIATAHNRGDECRQQPCVSFPME
jgi:TonB-dependent SusC/RagA subfamily outer membrane receptor